LPLRRQFLIIRTWLPLIALSVGVCALVAGIIASQFGPTYSSEVRLLVGPALGGTIDNGDIVAGQNLAPTYAELATTRAILERALASTGSKMSVEELQASITTHVPVSSGLISLSVATPDPDEAAQLANAIAAELKNYTSTTTQPTTSNIKLTVIDPAIPADRPAGPRVLFTAAIGAAIGLVLAVSVAFLIENVRRPETEAGVPADA
jgi:capsular polysaccharide biosynthesis protein